MHIILQNNIAEMNDTFCYQDELSESKLFELLCNYCIVSKYFFGRFDPKEVTSAEDDASLDGVAFVIDGDLITTVDDAEVLFQTHKSNLSVDIIFTQAKSGEKFKKEEISNFKMGLEDFLSLEPKLPNGDFNKESINIFKIVLNNLRKVRNRRPNCHVFYCTSGTYKPEREIKASFDIIKRSIEGLDFFHEVNITPLGRAELLKLYENISQKNSAKLKLIDFFGLEAIPGIPQSYIAVVNAKSYVESLLNIDDSNKELNQSVFEENVRSYLGGDNDVNKGIAATISSEDKRQYFSVLNNGITIVAPELTLTPNTKEITLTNYQIINGCQTSSTLHANQQQLDSSINVVIKFIESPDNDVSNDIISATNSQTDISMESFYGLKSKAKLVQKYFNAHNSNQQNDNKIYFERRQGEFKGLGYQSTKILDVREVARSYAAMFLNQAHNSARYVKTIFSQSGNNIFKEDDHESYYYCSALALYKYQTMINGRRNNAQNYIKLRWHIIQLYKHFVHNKIDFPPANSNKAEAYARKIIESLNSSDKKYIKIFDKCQVLIDSIHIESEDDFKTNKFTAEVHKKLEEALKKIPKQK